MRKYLFTSILILGCLICTAARPEHAAAEENETLPSPVHVSVHDPSIMEDKDGTFYIVGSHTASASSEDLIAWEQLNFDYGNGKNWLFTEICRRRWKSLSGGPDLTTETAAETDMQCGLRI